MFISIAILFAFAAVSIWFFNRVRARSATGYAKSGLGYYIKAIKITIRAGLGVFVLLALLGVIPLAWSFLGMVFFNKTGIATLSVLVVSHFVINGVEALYKAKEL